MKAIEKSTESKQTNERFIPIKERYPMIAKIMEAKQAESDWNGTPFCYGSDPDYEVLCNGTEALIEKILNQQYVVIDMESKEHPRITIKLDYLGGLREKINELVEMFAGCEVIAADYAFMQGFITCAQLRNDMLDGIREAQQE